MKATLLLMVFSVASLRVVAQQELDLLASTTPSGLSTEQTRSFLGYLDTYQRSPGSDKKVLHRLFHGIHARYLKSYVPYSTFDEIFTTGKYDCLTATALFQLALQRLGFHQEVIETNYHIYVLVHLGGSDIMLETTDRFGGFITDKDLIARRAASYINMEPDSKPGNTVFAYSFQISKSISAQQVAGLLYFNRAVSAFNHQAFEACEKLLEHAAQLYPSSRCEQLKKLLFLVRDEGIEASGGQTIGLLRNSAKQ